MSDWSQGKWAGADGKFEPVPDPFGEAKCNHCGGRPVAFVEFHTGGPFTPPPLGVWTFCCQKCHESRKP